MLWKNLDKGICGAVCIGLLDDNILAFETSLVELHSLTYPLNICFCRAEYYFKKATSVEPPDAEAHNKYATFLWIVKKDLWAAEESYLEAISADPSNTYYAANYAHFLWNTGGEETCYPLSSDDA